MSHTDTFELRGATEDFANFCSICIRRSEHFYELKPKGTIFVDKIFTNYQKPNRTFHVCTLCKLAIDFMTQFERLCETSRLVAENWGIIAIRSEYIEHDPEIQNALAAICQWTTNILEENMRMNKMEEQDDLVNIEHFSVESEFEEKKLVATVKSEVFLEEYLIDSDYEHQIEDDLESHQEIVLEIKPLQKKKSKKKEVTGSKLIFYNNIRQAQISIIFTRNPTNLYVSSRKLPN